MGRPVHTCSPTVNKGLMVERVGRGHAGAVHGVGRAGKGAGQGPPTLEAGAWAEETSPLACCK